MSEKHPTTRARDQKSGPTARGQLVQLPSGNFSARVRITIDGERVRKRVDLGTQDRTVARRKLARLLELERQGDGAAVAPAGAAPLTFAEAAREALTRWEGRAWHDGRPRGLKSAKQRFAMLERYAFPLVADRPIPSFHVRDALDVLDAAAAHGLHPQTLLHLKNAMSAVFDPFVDRGVLAANPAKIARLRAVEGVQTAPRRERAILTDDELAAYLAWTNPDERHAKATRERQVMAIVSRCFGGLRSGDLHGLRWDHFDPPHFTRGVALRRKTGTPQELEVPGVMRPALVAWWHEHGEPKTGLVFPALRGDRAGVGEKSGCSHAPELRRDLFRAGVRRHECTWHPPLVAPSWPAETINAAGRKRKASAPASCCPNLARDPLFVDTATSRPVDFHSFRRAFASGLAFAGVNLQTAMRLATSHAHAETHQRYVDKARALAVPDAALPKLTGPWPGAAAQSSSLLGAGHEIRTRDPQLGKLMLYQLS